MFNLFDSTVSHKSAGLFSKTDIYPYNPNVVDLSNFLPSEALQQEANQELTDVSIPGNPANVPSQFFTNKAANDTKKSHLRTSTVTLAMLSVKL